MVYHRLLDTVSCAICSRTLLFYPSYTNSLHLLIPNSQRIPPPAPLSNHNSLLYLWAYFCFMRFICVLFWSPHISDITWYAFLFLKNVGHFTDLCAILAQRSCWSLYCTNFSIYAAEGSTGLLFKHILQPFKWHLKSCCFLLSSQELPTVTGNNLFLKNRGKTSIFQVIYPSCF